MVRRGRSGLAFKPAGLTALIRRVIARHTTAIARRRLALHLRLDLTESEDYVQTDEVMLTEILSNVLDNAVKFTQAGRIDFGVELRSSAGAEAKELFVEAIVSDTGIGIPADLQPLLGTPFYQVDNASNRKEGGTGLRLGDRLPTGPGHRWHMEPLEHRRPRHRRPPQHPGRGRPRHRGHKPLALPGL